MGLFFNAREKIINKFGSTVFLIQNTRPEQVPCKSAKPTPDKAPEPAPEPSLEPTFEQALEPTPEKHVNEHLIQNCLIHLKQQKLKEKHHH